MIGDISDAIVERRTPIKYDEHRVEPILPSSPAHNHSQKDQDSGTENQNRSYHEAQEQPVLGKWQIGPDGRRFILA